MNEQIKLLAEQAGFVLWKDESWNPGDVIDWSCRYDDEFKKFAQLIVQECANICDKIYFDRYPDAEDFERSEEGDAIKKHFGVEE